MGFFFCGLSVGCSLAIAHLLKVVRSRQLKLLNVLAVNYLVASVVSLFTNSTPLSSISQAGLVPLLAIAIGVIFILNLVVYSASIHTMGLGISISSMRMSLLIPVSISLWLFDEHLPPTSYVGIFFVFVAFLWMMPSSKKVGEKSSLQWLLPVVLFVCTGLADSALKVYEQRFSQVLSPQLFLSLIFLSAFVVSVGLLIVKKQLQFNVKEILYGIGVGVANLYSSFFLLLALQELSGALVFALVNSSTVLLGTLIGIFYWKDTLSLKQKTGIVLAAISIVLLIL